MTTESLRRELYLGTRDLHDALDQRIGQFGGLGDYGRYLMGTFQFRAALEPGLTGADFPALEIIAELSLDLADLGLYSTTDLPPLALETHEAQVAALYVSEGSAVGARLISRKIAGLGLGESFGARHLARQIADRDRWPFFLDWLAAQDVAAERVVFEARGIFRLAMHAYQVNV
ncbi:biliverdin-producing heme oxygenase [Paracoccus litorisediminis]|uniref:biliverdin-producing heme oxygenase n=1 Tax=Paracoccus litorisediminis TaxID=2006130 RepID=UPI00373345C4